MILVLALTVLGAMTLTILERVKEIGTLRALGFTQRDITGLVVREAILLSAWLDSARGLSSGLRPHRRSMPRAFALPRQECRARSCSSWFLRHRSARSKLRWWFLVCALRRGLWCDPKPSATLLSFSPPKLDSPHESQHPAAYFPVAYRNVVRNWRHSIAALCTLAIGFVAPRLVPGLY